jgi:hypothetical protein
VQAGTDCGFATAAGFGDVASEVVWLKLRSLVEGAALASRRLGLLAAGGWHRAVSLVDGLVAAIAEARELAVLHYDADFELIASITGQAHQWVVQRGTAD